MPKSNVVSVTKLIQVIEMHVEYYNNESASVCTSQTIAEFDSGAVEDL